MEGNEATGMVWEALVQASQAWTAEDIASQTGLNAQAVRRALAPLREAQLLDVVKQGSRFAYTAQRKLDAWRWAKAVDLGVPLKSLEQHASLTSGARDQALRLAIEGRLEDRDRETAELKRQARERVLEGKAATRAAATDLARLAADTKAAAASGKNRRSAHERAVQKILERAATQADAAYRLLVERMR